MILRIAVYNMEWMRDLFHPDGTPMTTGKDGKRSQALADIVKALQMDFLGIVEGPDTMVSGAKTSSGQLLAWANHFIPGHTFSAVYGFPPRVSRNSVLFSTTTKSKSSSHPRRVTANDSMSPS